MALDSRLITRSAPHSRFALHGEQRLLRPTIGASACRSLLAVSALSLAVGCGNLNLNDVVEVLGENPGAVDAPTVAPPHAAAVERVNAVWQQAVEDGFSGVALVRHHGHVLGHFAAGMRNREAELPVELETAFDIGSLTKQFTAAAILHLYEQGQLSLNATLAELLPAVPDDKADISIHQLLTHTGGFVPTLGPDNEAIERDAFIERTWSTPLLEPPGTLHIYSNVGYSLLGIVIEELTQRPYEEYLVEEILRPAGLHRTGFLSPAWPPENVALGYLLGFPEDPLQRPHAVDGYYRNLRANGGLLSSVGDMTQWHDALLQGEVLGLEALELYVAPHVDAGFGTASYGYGWVVEQTEVGRLIGHGGANGFFLSEVRQYVDSDLLVIMLSNEENGASSYLPQNLAAAAEPLLPMAEQPTDDAEEPLALERLEVFEAESLEVSESIEFTEEYETASAGFLIRLEEGGAEWRVISPNGEEFAQGSVEAGASAEELMEIPRILGEWRLEVDVEEGTGQLLIGWQWD